MDEVATRPTSSESQRPALAKRSRPGGAVTCVSLCSTSHGDCTIAARGPFLEKRIGRRAIQKLLVFPNGGIIHGIRYSTSKEITEFDAVVFGGRLLSFCSLLKRADMACIDFSLNSQRISHMSLSHWIWDIQLLSEDNVTTTLAVGMSNHCIELWDFRMAGGALTVEAECRHRICGSPSCLVTSMDLRICKASNSLWVAAGTAFHEIRVWSYDINRTEDNPQESTAQPSSLLNGHAGVVHSVVFSSNGQSLASSSDDRSVRLWHYDESTAAWLLSWVGWGHSARVWSVIFVQSLGLVASAGEDGTMRLWSCATGESSGLIQHGSSLWTMDTLGDFAIVGTNDGTTSVYDLTSHVKDGKRVLAFNSLPVPDDRLEPKETLECVEASNETEPAPSTTTKKKKRKRKKQSVQVIVGIEWESKACDTLLVATRAGSLMRLHMRGYEWEIIDSWWESSLYENYDIQATDGCCMAIRQGSVAIGTTRGDIILKHTLKEAKHRHRFLRARDLKSVQGLKWIDLSTLVSFHVRTVAIWSFDTIEEDGILIEPTWVCELESGGKGVPLSCAFDRVKKVLIVGDSRGNLTLFILNGETNRILPASVAPRVHHKEHVNDVAIRKGRILSVGNDGCLHFCYISEDSLTKGWSIPASSMTGICEIWDHCKDSIWVSGYFGNTFRMIDMMTGYEFFHFDTGGRQRTSHCMAKFPTEDLASGISNYAIAVCVHQQNGTNSLLVKCVSGRTNQTNIPPALGLGVNMHTETIFGACFFAINKSNFLVSGSEDCSSKISLYGSDGIVDSISLTPQESCVRAVCASQFDDSSALIVVAGGKLVMQFFLVRQSQSSTTGNCASVQDLETMLRGQLKNRDKTTIDHRINAVKSLPIKRNASRNHLIVAGDSDGCCHIAIFCEESQGMVAPAIHVSTSSRPVLCIDLLVVGNRILVVLGNTGGEVLLFDLPSSYDELLEQWENLKREWRPLESYNAHQMGTNTIHTMHQESIDSSRLMICTGGDDQALCFCDILVSESSEGKLGLSLVSEPRLHKELSFSAIKGVFQFSHLGRSLVISVGYSQLLAVWEHFSEGPVLLKARISVDVGDVNFLGVLELKDRPSLILAVCGLGIENIELRKDCLVENTTKKS